MYDKLKSAKKESIILLLVIILISFLVSSISNIVFTEAYKEHAIPYIVIVSASLFVSALLAYLVLTRSLSSTSHKIKMLFAFDKSNNTFIDIPHCMSSVNARVLYNRLDEPHQNHIGSNARLMKFIGSDASKFIDDVVQMVLVCRLLNPCSYRIKGSVKTPCGSLPDSLKENKFVTSELKVEEGLFLPKGYAIEAINPRKSYFKVSSKYGSIAFSWTNSICQTAYDCGAFIDTVGKINSETCLEMYSFIDIESKFNFIRILSPKSKEFASWVAEMEKEFKEWDWSRAQKNLPALMLAEIAKKIDGRA
ncbi:hypothetical protein ACSV5M_02640 [Cellvibrio sp. ARAG 10.3]|uniref:hypothetical protein n=1 Tax=Cellvibrio sp. ARAG 10.3 TaxID=3451358 RepID=UPI003F48038F